MVRAEKIYIYRLNHLSLGFNIHTYIYTCKYSKKRGYKSERARKYTWKILEKEWGRVILCNHIIISKSKKI